MFSNAAGCMFNKILVLKKVIFFSIFKLFKFIILKIKFKILKIKNIYYFNILSKKKYFTITQYLKKSVAGETWFSSR
jgi:hypothetical protein